MDIGRMQQNRNAPTEVYKKDSEPEVQAILAEVRRYIGQLTIREQDPDLKDINVNELGEVDIFLLRRFMLGELSLKEIERHEKFLAGMREGNTPFKEGTLLKAAKSPLKLLAYMKKKLPAPGLARH